MKGRYMYVSKGRPAAVQKHATPPMSTQCVYITGNDKIEQASPNIRIANLDITRPGYVAKSCQHRFSRDRQISGLQNQS